MPAGPLHANGALGAVALPWADVAPLSTPRYHLTLTNVRRMTPNSKAFAETWLKEYRRLAASCDSDVHEERAVGSDSRSPYLALSPAWKSGEKAGST